MDSLKRKHLFINTVLKIIFIALLTAIVSEIKILPYENASFRFGLGSIIFFLAMLIQPLPIIISGFITGMMVILFRIGIDLFYYNDAFLHALMEHLPAALFYMVFAICLHFLPIEKFKMKPLILGLYGALFEIVANMLEQLTYALLHPSHFISIGSFALVCTVAILRSFSVVGIYSVITISEQKRQLEHLITITSGLYVESLYLQKSMTQIEHITANSFQLYKKLRPLDANLSSEALHISQEIHEVKKDAGRILAGLSKIVYDDQAELYNLTTLLHYVVSANEKYSMHLKKNIIISAQCNQPIYIKEHLSILAILNNLVANAIEAISHTGKITILATIEEKYLSITVADNGVGIDANALPVIFEPGYTSKFHADGFAATGIGLSHVQAIIEGLQGTINVLSDKQTIFTVKLPLQSICKEDS